MPNPRTRRDGGGSCFTCDACGGPEQFGATICLRPADSGKTVSKMPEAGCCAWAPASVVPLDKPGELSYIKDMRRAIRPAQDG